MRLESCAVPNVLSPRDLVFEPDLRKKTVHTCILVHYQCLGKNVDAENLSLMNKIVHVFLLVIHSRKK